MNEEQCSHKNSSEESYVTHFYLQTFITTVISCDDCGEILDEKQNELK